MQIILLLVLVLYVQETVPQLVQCYSTFDLTDGTCGNILGKVSFDDCCMNPLYGYKDDSNVCKSCRHASWTSCVMTEKVWEINKLNLVRKNLAAQKMDSGLTGVLGSHAQLLVKKDTKRTRTCTNPPPKCHGSCEGSSDESEICDTGIVCPTHGGWSAWGNWGACGGTCKVEGGFTPEQQRQRTCTNPYPSVEPRGNDCPGSSTDSQHCTNLPFCPVNGNWGPWLAFSECSVTCGVGQRTQNRNCDNPAPKHKGSACSGENSRTEICVVSKNCPANGHWDEWSQWGECESTNERGITCKNRLGRKRRTRSCVGRNYGGAPCDGDIITFEQCYDIEGCKAGPDQQIPQAIWSEWSKWGFCKPDCGENSIQSRTRKCIPDISKYRERRIEMFTGKPDISCQPLTGTEKAEENRPCLNLPKC
ncbi:hypothetical protein HF521_007049 [Silurus meridionalis]|uniref:Properdin n=1 Tax=Silurus meridionalis TaxID=175797 RepID=A0A8T0ASZ6_SILME|nr:hypothetical protein HF521_007049 [Silurus meridionalis]